MAAELQNPGDGDVVKKLLLSLLDRQRSFVQDQSNTKVALRKHAYPVQSNGANPTPHQGIPLPYSKWKGNISAHFWST